MKSEAECYSIDDLARAGVTSWEGVRNYQARNFMMNEMQIGDQVLFYHSNGTTSQPSGVYGIARIATPAHPDHGQFFVNDEHYDPKSTREKPIWYCVDVEYVSKFDNPVPLKVIKNDPELSGIPVAQTGSRLSIQPVSESHFEHIITLSKIL